MSVKMRLARGGRKKLPFYHVVVTDSRNPRDGKYIEKIGTYNPTAKLREGEIALVLKEDRLNHWHSVGAQPTDALAKLLVENGKGPKKLHETYKKAQETSLARKKKVADAKAAKEAALKAKEEAAEAAEAAAAETPAEEVTETVAE